jgi:hypothetical protein
MSAKSHGISFRLDPDLEPTVKQWLNQHPSISMSSLANMAIRGYVSNDQVLEGVKTVPASKVEVKDSLGKLMKKHKKTLDELK